MSIAELLKINPATVSKRLFFGKETVFATVWHIFDAALRLDNGATISLHDRVVFTNGRMTGCLTIPMTPQYTVDTLGDLEYARKLGDVVCNTCFRELELSVNEIRRDRLLRFE